MQKQPTQWPNNQRIAVLVTVMFEVWSEGKSPPYSELFPQAVGHLHRQGHEIAAHSYTQAFILPYLTVEEERDVIQRCKKVLKDAVGTEPVGWFSPVAAPTVHTADFLAEERFLWHGDYNDTDLPYAVSTSKGALIAIPHSDFTIIGCCAATREIFIRFTRTRLTFSIETSDVDAQPDRSCTFRRSADDVGDAQRAAEIYERFPAGLVRAPR